MGTSKSFPGPSGPQPLLPPWALPSNGPDQQPDDLTPSSHNLPKEQTSQITPQIMANWGPAKAALTRFARKPNRIGVRQAARAYIRSHGGSKNAANSSVSIGRPSQSLAAFISGVSQNGLDPTLRKLGLQNYIGKPAEVVLAGLLDYIAPSGDTNEEADARRAIVDTLIEMYEKLDLSNDGLSKLNALSEMDLKSSLLTCMSSYIYYRWIHELGIAIESKRISEIQALALEREMKSYIKEKVVYDFGSRPIRDIDFLSGEGKILINNLLQTAYKLIE